MTSRRRTRSFLPIAAVALLALPAFAAEVPDQLPDPNGKPDAKQAAPRTVHFDPVIKNIEGWTVHVDPQMLEGEHAEAGARALTMLTNHLQRIAILMPEDRLGNPSLTLVRFCHVESSVSDTVSLLPATCFRPAPDGTVRRR